MAATYILIASNTVGTATNSVSFNSIPQTYNDLFIVTSTRTNDTNIYGWFNYYFNGSNSSVATKFLEGSGATASSGTSSTYMYGGSNSGANATANSFGNTSIYIPNYTASIYKSSSVDSVGENNGTNAYSDLAASLWSNTAAITSITFTPANTTSINFVQYSTFYLYGIKNS